MAFSAIRSLKRSYLARFLSWIFVHNFVDLLAMATSRRVSSSGKKRVAFVKMDGVGDYIIWTAAFELIKQKYPSDKYERILICNERFRELAGSETAFDKKVYVNVARFASSPLYRFGVIREVRRLGVDIIVNPRLTRDFLWSDSLVRCSGASERIGSHGINNLMSPLQKRISDGWYSDLRPSPGNGVHELISNVQFLGFDTGLVQIQPRIAFDEPSVPQLDRGNGYAVIFVGAFSGEKRWPMAKFAETAKRLANIRGLKIVLCGGPGEETLADEFAKFYGDEFESLIGKTTLHELAAVIGNAKLTITNDTAAGHIAVAQRCPVVVITPGNHVGRFFPYPKAVEDLGQLQISALHEMPCFGCGWHCIYTDLAPSEPKPCISGVEVDTVLDAAERVLSARSMSGN